ncbi:MAG: efflux transporter outer membrane subunit [Myxococcota bacterium]|nr:efflux transporter outer membrane subunit [Myxococcota bacterium]
MKPIISTALLLGTMSACVPHTYVTRKQADPKVPNTFSMKKSNSQSNNLDSKWWMEFGDKELDSTIEQGLKNNLDIQMAAARFEQADAVARKLGAVYWPRFDLGVDAGRNQIINQFFGGGARTFNRFEVSMGVSYEFDLWGKFRTQRKGALRDAQASHEDVNAAIMSITARISETWYLLGEQRAQAVLLREQISVNETVLSLIQARFEQGLANALDVFQQKQQLLKTRRRLEPTLAQIRVLENQLDVLLGRAPTANRKEKRIQLPRLSGLPQIGVPLDLLQQRPDLRAAYARVKAADHRIASAIAERFPSLRLSASTGFLSGDISTIFDGLIWNVLGGFVLPLIDGGQRKAEVSRQRAILKMTLAQYKKVVITAVQEVEDALVQLERKESELIQLQAELNVARSAFTEAQNRYIQGLSSYLPVLTALVGMQEAERNELTAQRQLISHRIQLYRALGGGMKPPKQEESK